MSKFSKIFVAMAAISALAAPAFAVTADFTGFLQVRGIMTENLNGDDDRRDNGRFSDQRFRLFTHTALHENVKAVFAIETDNVWGDTGIGAVGTDAKSQIEVKHVYLDFNIPWANTNVKAGSQYFKLGGGIIQADDGAGLQVRYTPVKGQSLLLAWVKQVEGDTTSDASDSDYYHLQYDFDAAGWRLSPFVGYMNGTPAGTTLAGVFARDFEAYFVGAEASGKIGPLGVAATAIFNSWDNNNSTIGAAAGEDNTAWAAMVKGTLPLGATTLTAEAARYGDDKVGAFVNVRGFNPFSEIAAGGRFDNRNAGALGNTTTVAAGHTGFYMNWQYIKLGLEQKLNDKHKLSGYYIYAEEAEQRAKAAGDNPTRFTMGHEVNAYYDYAVSKGLTFTLAGAYLFADSDYQSRTGVNTYEGGDDAWKLGTALTYTF